LRSPAANVGVASIRAVAAALINAALRVNIGSILHLKGF
jgi:hypothetical protein